MTCYNPHVRGGILSTSELHRTPFFFSRANGRRGVGPRVPWPRRPAPTPHLPSNHPPRGLLLIGPLSTSSIHPSFPPVKSVSRSGCQQQRELNIQILLLREWNHRLHLRWTSQGKKQTFKNNDLWYIFIKTEAHGRLSGFFLKQCNHVAEKCHSWCRSPQLGSHTSESASHHPKDTNQERRNSMILEFFPFCSSHSRNSWLSAFGLSLRPPFSHEGWQALALQEPITFLWWARAFYFR